ncbi:alpha/beta hydrolase [Oceanobacillus piezotolerans]|uniref:Alpha/beta hydrolase n=2 Tax=Oceanobacillus piezotolerans TaxID=2448030 RepID=A0A498DBN3_9BACI|nr:alpha/beta fold hydrolase [Oceanobacillus piezotolerans]RLL48544.1 alpha/beta hydrolase [Oceanobacillus piezotolerans]
MKKENFVGYRKVDIIDDNLNVTFPMFVMYPTDTHEKEEKIGPYSINVAKEAKPKDAVYPLVLISHGSGRTPLVYRTLAHHLARNGFIVAMPEHPFNNLNDNHLENTIKLLESRPRNITQTIDWFYDDIFLKDCVDFDAISIIGHSMGGYTAIAAAGGIPTTLPWETDDQISRIINVDAEERIKKVILLAPALGWFRNKGAVDKVNLPILMISGEKDEITPSFHAEFLLNGLKNTGKIVHKSIENAGHFSFLSPFPEVMKNPSFPPSQDPSGFNRNLFHQELKSDVLNFLLR